MTISKKNLSVVIVSFFSQEVIHECIKSISNEVKIIVVENSGNKELKSVLEKNYRNVSCILSPINLGMGAGNNLGLSHIKTDFAFILNPDVVLEKNAIEEIIVASNNLDNFGLLAPLVNDNNYPNYKIGKKKNLLTKKDIPFQVESVDGFAMILNLKKLRQLNIFKNNKFFDENIFLYLENDDLCKKINDNNEKIIVIPRSKINHLGASAVSKEYNEEVELSRNWHWMWSKFYFNKKYNGFLIATINSLPSFLSAVIKIIFYTFINHKKRNIYFHRLSGFLNALLGKKSFYRPKIKN